MKKDDRVEILGSNSAPIRPGTHGTVVRVEGKIVAVRADEALEPQYKKMDWLFSINELKLIKEIPMSKVAFLKTNNSITVHYDGLTRVVAKDDARFEPVLKAIREGRLNDVPDLIDTEATLRKQGVEVKDGLVMVSGEAMPTELNARILEYQRDKLPFTSLKKFWENLRQNPSFNSRKQLFKFLENQGHSITEDGCFIGYRGVTEDFKDKHSRTFDNSPGSICEIARESVDDNPNNTCSHGLHVGGYKYAKDFGPKLVLVKVNPKDVVAVPADYNGQKMRVCKFEVLEECQNILTAPVVNAKGGKAELRDYSSLTNDPLASAKVGKRPVNKAQYKNNHNKRDASGKFASKAKGSTKRR